MRPHDTSKLQALKAQRAVVIRGAAAPPPPPAAKHPTPTVERDHDDGTTIVIAGDLLAELFGQ